MNLFPKLLSFIPASTLRSLSTLSFSRPNWRWKWLRRSVDGIATTLRHRDGFILLGAGKGLRFNVGGSSASFLLGTSETEVQTAMTEFLRPGMTVYDIGANVGFHACIASRLVGDSGHVVCFEPVPQNAAWLRHNAELNAFRQMVIREEALGAKDGTATFILSEKSTFGTLAGSGMPIAEKTGEIQVRVRTLDDLMAEKKLPPPDWIKMDVEGGEVGVIEGARKTLLASRPLMLVELHGTNRSVAALLEELGYVVLALDYPEPVVDAYWNAKLIGAPKERANQLAVIERLRRKKTG